MFLISLVDVVFLTLQIQFLHVFIFISLQSFLYVYIFYVQPLSLHPIYFVSFSLKCTLALVFLSCLDEKIPIHFSRIFIYIFNFCLLSPSLSFLSSFWFSFYIFFLLLLFHSFVSIFLYISSFSFSLLLFFLFFTFLLRQLLWSLFSIYSMSLNMFNSFTFFSSLTLVL